MALITCPECQENVSLAEAWTCPHCGQPIKVWRRRIINGGIGCLIFDILALLAFLYLIFFTCWL